MTTGPWRRHGGTEAVTCMSTQEMLEGLSPYIANWEQKCVRRHMEVQRDRIQEGVGTPTPGAVGCVVAGGQCGLPGPPQATVFDGLVLTKHWALSSQHCAMALLQGKLLWTSLLSAFPSVCPGWFYFSHPERKIYKQSCLNLHRGLLQVTQACLEHTVWLLRLQKSDYSFLLKPRGMSSCDVSHLDCDVFVWTVSAWKRSPKHQTTAGGDNG